MSEMIKIVVDAMGGDNAPAEIVKGAVEAVQQRPDIKVILTVQEAAVNAELSKYSHTQHDGRIFLFSDRHNRRFCRFNNFRGIYYFYLLFCIGIFA